MNKYIIDPDLVKKQLLKVLSSDRFRSSHLLCLFLEFVVEETLGGRIHEIKEYAIGTRVLAKPADFDPQTDVVVRIHAGRLRRMLQEYYSDKGLNDSITIGIPARGYIPVFEFRDSEWPIHPATPVEQPVNIKSEKRS